VSGWQLAHQYYLGSAQNPHPKFLFALLTLLLAEYLQQAHDIDLVICSLSTAHRAAKLLNSLQKALFLSAAAIQAALIAQAAQLPGAAPQIASCNQVPFGQFIRPFITTIANNS
jgi:hypothetical protein